MIRPFLFFSLACCLVIAPARGETDMSTYRTGTLSDDFVDEASGLVCPGRFDDGFWLHNDSENGDWLFRMDSAGLIEERIQVQGARNLDWEDISVLDGDGRRQLVIADIGDNSGMRSEVRLLVLDAPDFQDRTISVERSVHFRYPEGGLDSESMAIDSATGTAWLLSKRTVPAELYTVSLAGSGDQAQEAAFVGLLDTLPQPSEEDIALAPEKLDWFWQPTAMDFSPDGRRAAVLTYVGIYLYEREPGESWQAAFRRSPRTFMLGDDWLAEALCLTSDAAYWTTEGAGSDLFRIPLDDSNWIDP